MRIINGLAPGALKLKKQIGDISHAASVRLKWFDYYEAHHRNARLTCRHFGISPQTFYRWKRRYDPRHLETLEDRSHRPRRLRQVTYSTGLVTAVLRVREANPRWGKYKLAPLLRQEGHEVSVSMVGRILKRLRERGVLIEPVTNPVSAGKRRRLRPYGVRKPRDYTVQDAGDLVELDTLDIRPLPGLVYKHFTAHDVKSKWNVLGIYGRSTATTATQFLDILQERMPFPVKAIQVDGGAEFEALFESECQRRGIRLFVLPPRSPKLNGGVERAHRTHTEEFYEVTDSSYEIADLRQKLLAWERVYNTIRPHQALGYLTPEKYLTQHLRKEVRCH